jgi:hypothetical protein
MFWLISLYRFYRLNLLNRLVLLDNRGGNNRRDLRCRGCRYRLDNCRGFRYKSGGWRLILSNRYFDRLLFRFRP